MFIEDDLIFRIKRNKLPKREAIVLLSDFLSTSRQEAKEIYEEYIEKSQKLDKTTKK